MLGSQYGNGTTHGNASRKIQAEAQARRLYQHFSARNWMADVWSAVRQRSNRLLDLTAVQQGQTVLGHRNKGRQEVPVGQIKGSSTGAKCVDFDAGFRPLTRHSSSRWVSVATALKLGSKLPPVELVQVGDIYFVTDGHHRVSVAQAMGYETIEARVTVLELAAPAAA